MRRLALALAAVVSSIVLLTGCGGAQTDAPSASSAQPSSADQPSSAGQPSSTGTTPAAAPASPSESTEGEESGGAGKPSKQEIVTGLSKFYEQTQGLSGAKAKKFAVCMVDQMYAKAKTATLKAMRDGDPTKIDKSDIGLVAEAGSTCQPALA